MTHETPQPPDPQNQPPLLQVYEQQFDPQDPGGAVVMLHEMGVLTGELRRQLPDSQRREEVDDLLRHAEGSFGILKFRAAEAVGYDLVTDSYDETVESTTIEFHPGVPGGPNDDQTIRQQGVALRYADQLSSAAKLLTRLNEFAQAETPSPYDIGQENPRLAEALRLHCLGVHANSIEKLSKPESVAFKNAVLGFLMRSSDPRDKVLAVALERGIHYANNADRFKQ